MKRVLYASSLIVTIVLSATWVGLTLEGQRPYLPILGASHQSKVDASGHTRGIVQVDLMRRIMADTARSVVPPSVSRGEAGRQAPTQDHFLLGRRAPSLALRDSQGKTWNLDEEVSGGPVVIVFYLGSTCVACVTHLVELDVAAPRFSELGARVWAVSADTPEFSRERIRKFGDFKLPLLSDVNHLAATDYRVWKPIPGGDKDDGEAFHGTVIIGGDGFVRWAYVGDRPFTDIEALLLECSRLGKAPRNP